MAAGPKKFEQYKYFSVVAWTLVLAFSGLVLYLVLDLRETATRLQGTSMNLNQQMEEVEALFEKNSNATNTRNQRL
jgi:amino acid permease